MQKMSVGRCASKKASGRLRATLVAGLLLLAMLATWGPAGSAQVPPLEDLLPDDLDPEDLLPDEPDIPEIPDPQLGVRVESLQAPQPIIAAEADDAFGDNTITGTIRNSGDAPLNIRVTLEALNAEGPIASWSTTMLAVAPGEARPLPPQDWGGPDDRADEEVTFRLTAVPILGGSETGLEVGPAHERMIVRDVHWHGFLLETVDGPGDTIQSGSSEVIATVKVTNTGNVPATARLSVPDGEDGWTFDVAPPTRILQAGESKEINVNAAAPEDPAKVGTGLDDVRLEVRSSEARVVDAAGRSPVLDEVQLSTPTVQAGDELVVGLDPLAQTASAGQTIHYTLTVYNPTASAEEFDVSVEALDDDEDGDVQFVASQADGTVMSGQTLDVTITATSADDALATSSHWIIETTVPDPDGGEPRFEHTVSPSLEIVQEYAVGLEVLEPSGAFSVEPGMTLTVPLEASNLGNGRDTLCIESSDLPAGWTAGPPCIDVDAAKAPAGSSERWNLTEALDWTVALDTAAEAGTHAITLRATSSDPDTDASPGRQITVDVLANPHPELVPPFVIRPAILEGGTSQSGPQVTETEVVPCLAAVDQDDTVQIPFSVQNVGNDAGSFAIQADVTEMKPAGWSTEFSATQWQLDAGDSAQSVLTVSAPPLLVPSDILTFTVTLQDEDKGRTRTVSCTVVPALPELVVVAAEAHTVPDELYTGHPATLHFQVANLGWKATGQDLAVETIITDPDGLEDSTTQDVGSLDAWSTTGWWRPLDVSFNATTAGDHLVEVRVDPDGVLLKLGGSVHDLPTLPVRDFGVSVDAPAGMTVIPGQTISLKGDQGFRVVNQEGGENHLVDISIQMDPPWRTFETIQDFSLGSGDFHTIDVQFTVPETPLAPEARVTVQVSKATLPALAVQGSTGFKIDDEDPPAITGFVASAQHVLPGGSIDFSADIHDSTGIAQAQLVVVDPQGTSTNVPMVGDGPVGRFNATHTFDSIGFHQVHVWARDASEDANTADTLSTHTIQVEVLPDHIPSIRLVTPGNDTAVRPGTPLVFTVLGPQPILDVEYQLDGSGEPTPVAATNPVQVATDDWSEGPVALRLFARDAAGVRVQEDFAFRMDGTAPTISGLALDPPDGPSGSSVTVTATVLDDSAIASVVLRVEHLGGRADEHAMELVQGAWRVQFTMPPQPAGIAVVATDEAGNRGYAEQSFEVAAVDEGDRAFNVPNPSLAASVLVLLAIVAFARSRRVSGR